jgi:hypothetical protein
MVPEIVVAVRGKVLIADDEPDANAITRLSLRDLVHYQEPVELISANSGRERWQAAGCVLPVFPTAM